MPNLATRVSLALLVLCLLLAGCLAQGRNARPTPTPSNDVSIPFETIATNDTNRTAELGEAPVSSSYLPSIVSELTEGDPKEHPWLALVTTLEEALPLSPYLAPEQQEVLAELDYEEYTALVMFVGVGGGSAPIYINRIAAEADGTIKVHVVFLTSNSGTADIDYASEIVRIRRTDIPVEVSRDGPFAITITSQPLDQ